MKLRGLERRGMSLLSLPSGKREKGNVRRRGVENLGGVTAAELFYRTGTSTSVPIIHCGRHQKGFALCRQAVKQEKRPFLLIRPQCDADSRCVELLKPQWTVDTPPQRLQEGSGQLILTENTGESVLYLKNCLPRWGSHYLILCVGNGLQIDNELLNLLNAHGGYFLLCSDLHRSVTGTETARLTAEELLLCMGSVFVSGIGSGARELLNVLPTYEAERYTNHLDFNLSRGGHFGAFPHGHRSSGLSFGQAKMLETKPVFQQEELAGLQRRGELVAYSAASRRVWTAVVTR